MESAPPSCVLDKGLTHTAPFLNDYLLYAKDQWAMWGQESDQYFIALLAVLLTEVTVQLKLILMWIFQLVMQWMPK